MSRVRRRRRIRGMSAVLLPFRGPDGPDGAHGPEGPGREIGGPDARTRGSDAQIDWASYRALLLRTVEAGLTPAVNMDTGYVQLLDGGTRTRVLDIAAEVTAGDFVAGAQVPDSPGAALALDAYQREMEQIAQRGGVPVVFPSHGLNALEGMDWAAAHAALATHFDRFIGFELGAMFVPYGRIHDLEAYAALMAIPQCIGAKHSSLSRALEWERLALRDRERPEFLVLTGNDLAIDMVMYGSDYLLGLSAFAPEAFARRDRMWLEDDPGFFELNDLLQYLGCFAFRAPVPAYKHDAAMFLHLRGRIASSATHPGSPERPESDVAVLREIAERLDAIGAA